MPAPPLPQAVMIKNVSKQYQRFLLEGTESPQLRTTIPGLNDDVKIDHVSEISDDNILDEFFSNSGNDEWTVYLQGQKMTNIS